MKTTEQYVKELQGPILVLGASGFIGANLLHQILAIRSDVYGVVRHQKSWRLADVLDDKIIECDLTDPVATKNLIVEVTPQTVFDCVAYGAYSFEEEVSKIYETNFQSLVSLVGNLTKTNIKAFIHAGSSSEYGSNAAGPTEDALCTPNSHYAVSKVSAANFLEYMGKQRQFPCVHLRLYSIYGPLEDTSRLIPNVMRCANNGTLPPFVDARTSRDFVYVDDACRAFIMAAAQISPKLYGEIFNVGSGQKTTIGDLANLVRREYAIESEPQFGSMEGRRWDMPDWFSNSQKAKKELDWIATMPLDVGLRKTAQWVEKLSDESFITSTKKNIHRQYRSVSAIVACYRDAQAIPHMYRRLTETFQKLSIDYEIIFVNDCSPDHSVQVIEEISAQDPHVIGICHSRNFGSQMAFRSGMELATMNSVVFLDGDLQDPPELIEQFHQQWTKGFDVVYGRRVKRDMPWHWGLMYKGFYRIFSAFSYLPIPHDSGDFSLIDRRAVGWLLQCGERDLFMRGLRAYVGFKQTGVDYIRPERMFGVSTNNLFKNIEWAKRGIFSFSNAPLTMLTSVGIISLFLSCVLAFVVTLLKVFFPDIAPKGATTLLIAILIFGSLNLFGIGLVGEYVAKIMTEVKARPRLIRSALIRRGKTSELLPDGKVYLH
jgi:nucleoside-diphosphate-sugar epimerase/glycosyltransferase involved in cell wall biosynthesis